MAEAPAPGVGEKRRLKIQLDCETGAWTIRWPASRPEETKPSQQNKTGIAGDGWRRDNKNKHKEEQAKIFFLNAVL